MTTLINCTKPSIGMTLAFTDASAPTLTDIPGKVIHIWPRFRSGDYLVTLEYDQPVKFRNQFIKYIDAFVSELYQPEADQHEYSDLR